MADGYKLLPSDGFDTLARLCTDLKVGVTDVWVPLQLLRSGRGGGEAPVPISPATPISLLDRTTGELLTRRSDILARLHLLCFDEQNLAVPPAAVPADCTLFARATKDMSRRRLKGGMPVLYRPITGEQAVAEGSALVTETSCAARRDTQQTDAKSVVDASIASEGVDTTGERRRKRAKVDDLFEEYLQSALAKSSGGRSTHSGVIIKETMANLVRVRDATPLHFVMHGKAQKVIQVKGVTWNIPDGRVMYRTFRRGGTADGSAKFTHTDAARLIAVFMIDNVLLRREPARANTEYRPAAWSLIDPDLPAAAHRLAERGYRILLLDHYPSLHHGNLVTLEAKLQPIAELCQQYFTCDVTVILSTMSYISASHRRDGKPFVLPYSGLWQFFIAQLNGGLRTDADSFLVGRSAAGTGDDVTDASFQGQRDVQFAMNCGLRHVDSDTLKKETLQS